MPVFEVTDNKTGKVYEITGDRAPTQGEVESLITSALPQPSIWERTVANALHGGDENARKAFLLNKGKNPNEPGMFTSPRETLADVMESAGPISKMGGMVVGGAFGGRLGVPGAVAGVGMGAGAVQAGWEGLADITGLGESEAMKRIHQTTAGGSLAEATGQALGAGLNLVKKIPLVKKGEEYMLTNITKASGGLQDWVKGRWTTVYNAASDPLRTLSKKVDAEVVEPIKRIRSILGSKVTEAKNLIYKGGNIPDFSGIARDVYENVLPSYISNITSEEARAMLHLVVKLERAGLTPGLEASTLAGKSGADVLKQASRLGRGAQARKRAIIEALDELTIMQRKISSQYGKLTPGDINNVSAITSLFSTVRQRVMDKIKIANPDLAPALDAYTKYMDILNEFNSYVGHDKKQILSFLTDHLFADETSANVYGRDAINLMFSPEYLGKGNLMRFKDLVAANWMRSGEVATSGLKFYLPRAVATGVGATTGALLGGKEGWKRGALIGGGVGLGMTFPYSTPAWAAYMYKKLEKTQPVREFAGRAVEFGLRQGSKLLAQPLTSAINEISNQFGIDASKEDINRLRSSKIK